MQDPFSVCELTRQLWSVLEVRIALLGRVSELRLRNDPFFSQLELHQCIYWYLPKYGLIKAPSNPRPEDRLYIYDRYLTLKAEGPESYIAKRPVQRAWRIYREI